jgi:23S rRNA pseudouridine1911/1915/1917 synthase
MGEGRVTVDGALARPSMEALPGQEVVLDLPDPRPVDVVPADIPVRVLYQDEDCLAVDKPSGLVTHPAKGHWDDTLVNALAALGVPLSRGYAQGRPGILHRLDKETSGVLLVAKTDRGQACLHRQFKDRTVRKTYTALAWGRLPRQEVEVSAPVGRDPRNRKKMAVVEGGREAATLFSVQEELPHISLVEARPRTGRTHQIRVHLAHLRHPVVGDALYGGHPENGLPSPALKRAVKESGRFFLHARALAFESPGAGPVVVESPLPESFGRLMEIFRRHG